MPTVKSSCQHPHVRLGTVDAVVLSDENLYFLSARDGGVPLGGKHALGLYYHDTRFLDGYELLVGGVKPEGLVAAAESTYMATLELTNPDFISVTGKPIEKQRIGIKWERIIEAAKLGLLDRITFRNFGIEPIELAISLTFQAGFQDIFSIRGVKNKKTGKLRAPTWDNGVLRFLYKGVDKIYRGAAIHFSPAVEPVDNGGGQLQMKLRPGESKQLRVSAMISEFAEEARATPHGYVASDFDALVSELHRKVREWEAGRTGIKSDARRVACPHPSRAVASSHRRQWNVLPSSFRSPLVGSRPWVLQRR